MKKGFVLILSVVFFAAACNQVKAPTAIINGHIINLEIAETPAEQAKGLSNRDSLSEDSGMLFVFEKFGKHEFWMKDMRFPLDFIWIKDGKVFEIIANVPIEPNVPESQLHHYTSSQPIDSIIEVNAGWVERNQIKVGHSVIIRE